MENFVSRETLTAAKMNKLVDELNGKQDKISDLATIRSNASAGKSANDSLGGKQDTISDLSQIRSNAASGASAASAIAAMFGDLVAIVYVEEEPANPAANTIYLIKEED